MDILPQLPETLGSRSKRGAIPYFLLELALQSWPWLIPLGIKTNLHLSVMGSGGEDCSGSTSAPRRLLRTHLSKQKLASEF